MARNKHGLIEETEQIFAVAWFEAAYPMYQDILLHYPAGGKRHIRTAARLKRMGAKAGVSDLFLPLPRGGFHGLWMEYKPAPPAPGRLQPSQSRWLKRMADLGYRTACVRGPMAFASLVAEYLNEPPAISMETFFRRNLIAKPADYPVWLCDQLLCQP